MQLIAQYHSAPPLPADPTAQAALGPTPPTLASATVPRPAGVTFVHAAPLPPPVDELQLALHAQAAPLPPDEPTANRWLESVAQSPANDTVDGGIVPAPPVRRAQLAVASVQFAEQTSTVPPEPTATTPTVPVIPVSGVPDGRTELLGVTFIQMALLFAVPAIAVVQFALHAQTTPLPPDDPVA
jgi:hypothetical protein